MNDITIYFSDDSELGEYEAQNKGYRSDVVVRTGNNFYKIMIYAMIRLQQDFNSEIKNYGFYAMEPNMILVNDTNKNEIIETIKKNYEQKYFIELKPSENLPIEQLTKVFWINC